MINNERNDIINEFKRREKMKLYKKNLKIIMKIRS